mgnify:FL=1|tara:strand:- start:8896 stop:9756 length:861 start_codon:yes stop_codon:yes gene_type:complete
MNIIFGAGKFSNVHLKVLKEKGIRKAILAKKSSWTDKQKQEFKNKHDDMKLFFDNQPNIYNETIHIVTPSKTHAKVLYENKNAKKIFIEKPAVLFNSDSDYILSNKVNELIWQYGLVVYQNDWLSQTLHYRINKGKPYSIDFTYHVKNPNNEDHITEIASHAMILLSKWCSVNSKIKLNFESIGDQYTVLNFTIDDIKVHLNMSNGLRDKSFWSLKIDDEYFSTDNIGHALMSNTMNVMLKDLKPFTDWYESSWLIHKLRLIKDEDLYQEHLKGYYEKNKETRTKY